MAALELILSHARRHCTKLSSSPQISLTLFRSSLQQSNPTNFLGFLKPQIQSPISTSTSPFLSFPRYFSSTNTPKGEQPPNDSPIKPVSYAPKPQEYEKLGEARESEGSGEAKNVEETQAWTREDARYVRNVGRMSITPVSYPVKVAPLPADREEKKEVVTKEDEELRIGRMRIEMDARRRRSFRTEEEAVTTVLPFPGLIKAKKKKQRVVVDLQEAIREVKANAKRKFVETVEAHVSLGVDPRRGDQMVRGATTLPHGTGKTVRVAVFADGVTADEARAAGADIVGGDELIEEIRSGGGSKLNFDKCISTPNFMPRLGKIARILGPRGLMPNPKLGTVTNNVAGAVQESKQGRVDFKIDKTAIVHVGLGKVSFSEESLRENIGAFVNALLLAKPVGLKKTSKYAGYMNSFTLCSTVSSMTLLTFENPILLIDLHR
ncbi:hypothetical protein GIB67_000137 [Kingdonia uniflora]|uniref:Large ribosomal subunit protein uL1c n=1 Tax=Kingdonia uniflora TaxID=39325 RepID=A0A7J7P9L9_9MAGN|nr:hypothetical protein GIB67_000137 [Kingdonia uniflora]